MNQLIDAVSENKVSSELALFSTAELERELEIRKTVVTIQDNLRAYDAIRYEDKEFIDFDDNGAPYNSEA